MSPYAARMIYSQHRLTLSQTSAAAFHSAKAPTAGSNIAATFMAHSLTHDTGRSRSDNNNKFNHHHRYILLFVGPFLSLPCFFHAIFDSSRAWEIELARLASQAQAEGTIAPLYRYMAPL